MGITKRQQKVVQYVTIPQVFCDQLADNFRPSGFENMVEDLRPIMGPKMEVLRDDVVQCAKNRKIVCQRSGCTIATKTKINVFRFFFFLYSGRFEAAPFEKFQKTLYQIVRLSKITLFCRFLECTVNYYICSNTKKDNTCESLGVRTNWR